MGNHAHTYSVYNAYWLFSLLSDWWAVRWRDRNTSERFVLRCRRSNSRQLNEWAAQKNEWTNDAIPVKGLAISEARPYFLADSALYDVASRKRGSR